MPCKKRSLASTRDGSSMVPEDPLRRALSAARRTVCWRRRQLLRAQQGRPPTEHSSGGALAEEGRGLIPSSSAPSRGAWEEDIAGDIEMRLEAVLGRWKRQLEAEQSSAPRRCGSSFEEYGSFLVPEADEEPQSTSSRALPQKEAAKAGGFSPGTNPAPQAHPARVGRGKRVFPDQHPAAGSRGASLVRCSRPPAGASTTNGGKGVGAFEKRLEAVLGDRRRRFESGKINPRNLVAMFGQ